MPYADPTVAKQKAKERYQNNKHLWKNPDGSWKRSKPNLENKRNYYYKNKDKIKNQARVRRQRELQSRPNICPLCNTQTFLVYDHCHTSLKFRGYICSPCNLALGHAKDNIQTLQHMIEYLKREL